MAFFRHRHVTGFPGFPDRRKERDVIVTSLSLPGHGPARVFAERLPWAKQWLTTGARTRRARRNCSALAMGKAMDFPMAGGPRKGCGNHFTFTNHR